MENLNTEKCIKYLLSKDNECDVSFLSNAKLKEIVSTILNWDIANASKQAKQTLEQEEKRRKYMAEREDYKEEKDESGRVWYCKTHSEEQREESRLLKKGDAILFKCWKGCGFMIVDKFDYKSDFAARGYYMEEQFTGDDGLQHTIRGSDLAPGIDKFSFATEEEMHKYQKVP